MLPAFRSSISPRFSSDFFGGFSLFTEESLLEGADGLTTDVGNNLRLFADERDAIVRVALHGEAMRSRIMTATVRWSFPLCKLS